MGTKHEKQGHHRKGELGGLSGGMGVQAVAKACERMGEKLKTDKRLRRELARACRVIEEGKRANV